MLLLNDVRVLDFGRYIAGPFCAALLGDLGADVIRIEKVDGSEDRFTTPVSRDGDGAGFMQLNRNKRGITLNPRTPEGRQILERLIPTADVVIANLPPDTLASMGLDYESLCQHRSDIILTTSTAFGASGPYATRVGFDGVAQAMSGNLHMTGNADEPTKNYFPYVDFTTASLNAMATLAAIIHRTKNGEGQHVQGCLLASALSIANGTMIEQALLGVNRSGTGNRGQTSAPSDTFQTKDGWILVQVVGNPLYERWARLMGEDSWLVDSKYSTDESRGLHAVDISTRMQEWTSSRTTTEAVKALEDARIPCGEVLSPQGALDNEQVQSMGFLESIDYPGIDTPAPIAHMPMDFSTLDVSIRRRAPTLGEHTNEILESLGFEKSEIISFREARAI
ncbi:MAG: CoA transferase [Pseudomonadales bacterium]|jgi:crotonobetainyl-CoA:carnitine CoA-transferase CaiB-like acyl-CoA transferase|nr:CoA transferase [Pseudomonadales bacterium]MEC9239099.1 CoA transferase [Pseudomonadota bacterium]MEC9251356.1 CoA transferase [Pseudomonadota bacterium]MEE3132753.1 CoA transferase [Pseudomonadota bacterium]|tara:strand:- start:761 stop:1942 length:1182 start_codon:yes stop_codon:yes gene_type:complete